MTASRLGCSSISFRHLDLPDALAAMAELGFTEIDLGSLPGVCDHVPLDLDRAGIARVVGAVRDSGLTVRSINVDVGDLNDPRTRMHDSEHLFRLLELAAVLEAKAIVLPNGALEHTPMTDLDDDLLRVADNLEFVLDRGRLLGVDLWVESLHVWRLCCNHTRAAALTERLHPDIGIVMDFSHIVASGGDPVDFVQDTAGRIAHVHIRDALRGHVQLDTEPISDRPGNINLSVGRGDVDFASGLRALDAAGYGGHFTLELETRDVTDDERPAATAAAAQNIGELLTFAA
ncbi:sugar phosphate isomerase/epimerase [Nocardia sp. 348MFTsu5.1]|uniref:sugar phosphate isomerase/epimerase family protein n=1 Tax=Nocardia sp. 348MFTsu5.1 TaxID=1172185 RepID=UPI00048F98EB|nr:sugar phosphate isomerase/epimerase [Nocardia sp. 348MFTsu5.1]